MGGASKEKGNAWELEVAKFLEENFEGKFSRVPRSGAMFGGENAENAEGERQDVVEILSGDIITPKDFPFTIEAKHYDDFTNLWLRNEYVKIPLFEDEILNKKIDLMLITKSVD